MDIKKVVVAGGGVLGSQIAFQAAYVGYDVTVWLRSEGSIGRTQPKLDHVKASYIETIKQMEAKTPGVWASGIADADDFDAAKCLEKVEKAYTRLKIELDMAKAVADADIVIESMSENPDDKIAVYKKMAPLLDEKTILVTNSSTLLPSQFAEYTGRPEKYLALHFANTIWVNNMVEVMAQPKTDPKIFDEVMAFAKDLRMIPLPLHKEKSGYLLNSMLVPLLSAAQDLNVEGISDPESIDKAWTVGTGAKYGPFRIIDIVGLKTAYDIISMLAATVPPEVAPYNYKGQAEVLKKYIDEGKLGMIAGEGFYKYKK